MKIDLMLDRLETMRKQPLTDEEKHEVNLWNKGRALSQIIVTEGWEVVLEMLQSYAGDAIEQLMKIVPGDDKEVVFQHAVAYAAGKIYTNFISDANQAVEASRVTPGCVKEGLKAGPAPVESSM
jgi:hypothetical protein